MASVSVAVALAAISASGSTWWNANGDGTSWSDGANWSSGNPPPATDPAKFEHQGAGKYYFRLTPPADYTAAIIVDDEWYGEPATGTLKRFPITLELTVLDGAEWTVQGPGTIIATDGIADRLSAQFTGVIEVPAGRSFTAPASLNAAVRFIGAGELTLATAAQVENASGFTGTIHLPGDYSPSSLALLQNAEVVLPDGATLTLSQSLVGYTDIEPLAGFDEAGAWSLNGTRFIAGPNAEGPDGGAHEYSAMPPSVTAEGDLELINDPGQTHSAFLDRKFRLTDDWGVSFTWKPELPADSRWVQYGWHQTWSGYFGFFMQNTALDNVNIDTKISPLMTTNSYGFTIHNYRDTGTQHFEWTGLIGYGYDDGVRETALDGILFTQPVDFDISCRGGVIVVNMMQDGKSASFHEDLSSVIAAAGEGLYIGFAGASDNWTNNVTTIPWFKQTISDFKGWCTTRYSSGWQPVAAQSSYYPFSDSTWQMASFFDNGEVGCVTNRGDDAAINQDGSFQIVPARNKAAGLVTSRQTVDVANPVKISFDYRFDAAPGGAPGSAESVEFAIQKMALNDNALLNLNAMAGGGYIGQISNWGFGWGFRYYFWGEGQIQLIRYVDRFAAEYGGDAQHTPIRDTYAGILVPRPYSTAHFDVVYDAKGSMRVHGSITPDDPAVAGSDAEFVQTLSEANFKDFQDAMANRGRMTFAGYSSNASEDRYQSTAIKNLTVSELVDNAAPELACTLSVPASASATVALESVMDGGASPSASVATLSLGDGATLNIAPLTAGGVAVLEAKRIETAGPATVSAASGATLRVGEYVPAGAKDEPLAIEGAVAFPAQLVVRMPDAWTTPKPTGLYQLFDLSQATASALPETVALLDASGNPPAKRFKTRISDTAISVEFLEPATMVLFR